MGTQQHLGIGLAKTFHLNLIKVLVPTSILEEIQRLMLKLQYFGHLMWRANSLEKILMLGLKAGGGDGRGWNGWMASQTRWTWVWANSGRWLRTGKTSRLQSMGLQRVGHNWATEQQQRIEEQVSPPKKAEESWRYVAEQITWLLQCLTDKTNRATLF